MSSMSCFFRLSVVCRWIVCLSVQVFCLCLFGRKNEADGLTGGAADHPQGPFQVPRSQEIKMAVNSVVVVTVVFVVFLVFLLKKYLAGRACPSTARLDGKTVIITGANTGIGKETAVDLAQRGARVIIACRDKHKGNTALKEIQQRSNNNQVYLEHLDLASFKSVREFAERIKQNESKLHILINNAGVSMGNKLVLTEDGIETTFAVNHLGHFLLTKLLLDLLKKSAPSRIINVSSDAHKFAKKVDYDNISNPTTFSPFPAYSQSKFANVLFTKELAKRLQGTGVTVYALHPGAVGTEIFRNIGGLLKYVVAVFANTIMKSPKQGAQTTIYCTVAKELEGISGRYYNDCTEQQPCDYAKDDQATKKLWDMSAKYVGL